MGSTATKGTIAPQVAGQIRKRERRIAAGELVSNKMYRDRVLWLVENDPTFNLSAVCGRLSGLGLGEFVSKHPGKGMAAQTSRLQRLLGIRRQTNSNHASHHSIYRGKKSEWITREMAIALYEALDMDPLIEAGLVDEVRHRDRISPRCAWGEGCEELRGHGMFERFCEEHAKRLGEMRATFVTPRFGRRGNRGRPVTQRGRDLETAWEDQMLAEVGA